jgi:heat shock protein HslJ
MSYRSGDEMLIPDDRAAASLTIDGTLVSGSMGVNRFSGQMGAEFPIGPIATTRMAGPPELMLQEDTILEHLQEADTIEVIEDGMTLSRDGLLLVELERTETALSDLSS